ncbi:MAG: DUF1287 domain-containing protein [Chitinophagaceae bacterium]|jgi:hypothetical protein
MRSFIAVVFAGIFLGAAPDKYDFFQQLAQAAAQLTKQPVTYDPSYYNIPYPNGDVPANKGVCADVVIRAYRKLGIDLQQLVHEDMLQNFQAYPQKWGLRQTDKNIDHRRVLNLATFFSRKGTILAVNNNAKSYQPGDIVCWMVNGKLPHIGIVVIPKSSDQQRHLIVHNIGRGQVIEDVLFSYPITGHYRYQP